MERQPVKDGYRRCARCEEYNINIEEHPKAKFCKKCLKLERSLNLRDGRKARKDLRRARQEIEKPTPEYQSFVTLKAPDGSIVRLRDEEEKSFYENRRNQYQADFEWNTSADNSLLSRLLFIEMECKRQEDLVSDSRSHEKTEQLMRLTNMLRNLQTNLGIDRQKRMSESEKASAKSIIQEKLKKFKEYREKNKDRYCYKCEACGHLNYTYREKNA